MALIKCPECGKEVSNRAAACVFCGCPIESTASGVLRVRYDRDSICKLVGKIKITVTFNGITECFLRGYPKGYPESSASYYGSRDFVVPADEKTRTCYISCEQCIHGVSKGEKLNISIGSGENKEIIIVYDYYFEKWGVREKPFWPK